MGVSKSLRRLHQNNLSEREKFTFLIFSVERINGSCTNVMRFEHTHTHTCAFHTFAFI